MALTTFARFGSRRPKANADPFDILGDLVPWQESVDANAGKIDSAGFRNVVRNALLEVAQRGTGPFTADGYTVDGVRMAFSGGTMSVTRVAIDYVNDLPGGDPLLAPDTRYALRSVVAAQAGSSNFAEQRRRIEGANTLASSDTYSNGRAHAMVSFWARQHGGGGAKLRTECIRSYGTGGSPSPGDTFGAGDVTLTSLWQRFTLPVSLPMDPSRILGTAGNDYLDVVHTLSAGATARAAGVGLQNVTIDIAGVQLEYGDTATPLERVPQALELARCQRFYRRMVAGTAAGVFGHGLARSATAATIVIPFPVPMRIAPPVFGTGSTYTLHDGVTGTTGAAANALAVSAHGATLDLTVGAGLTQFRPYIMQASADATAWIDFSAEL